MRRVLAANTRPLHRALLLVLALVAAGTLACTHRAHRGADEAGDTGPVLPEFVFVAVENHNWSDIIVSVISNDGRVTRIGTVNGSSNAVLRFPGYLMVSGPSLQLVARAVGGRTEVRSERVVVQPGQQVTWTIETSLGRSSIAVF
jgi:hypothetical protein